MYRKTGPMILLLAFCAFGQPLAGQDGQEQIAKTVERTSENSASLLDLPAGLKAEGITLSTALTRLGYKTGVGFAFSPSLIPADKLVDCDCEELTIREALEQLLDGTGLHYTVLGNQVVVEQQRLQMPLRVLPPSPVEPVLAAVSAPRRGVSYSPPVAVSATPQTGIVMGEILSDRTNEPMPGVQVTVVGTTIGGLTNQQGRFRLSNVPVGEREIQAQRIGYRTTTERVTVVPGEVAVVNMSLRQMAVELDAVVVTGQAQAVARREVGTSVATIRTDQLEVQPITTVSQMLQSRAPGVTVLTGGGQAGQGSRIVLRGITSTSQDVEPVIYVDGIRITNERGGGVSHDATTSGLDEINPADIERIEVIRGAAAATMYGTEASGGVIQIFTHQGADQDQVWTASSEYGIRHADQDHFGVSIYGDWFYDTIIRTGNQHRQHLSVRGTMDRFSYNASGTVRRTVGVLDNDNDEQRSFRANMRFTPTDNFSLNINTGYSWRLTQFAENGNNSQNIVLNAFRGGPPGYHHPPEELHTREDFQNSGRFTAGIAAAWTPFEGFGNRLQFGADIVNWDNHRHRPYGDDRYPVGHLYNYRRETLSLTLDYTGSYTFSLTDNIESRTSFGFQGRDRERSSNHARGWRMMGPNVRVVAATANRGASEWRSWDRQAGVFGEQQLGFNDRFYVTVGARKDGHSAFGADAGWATYPKVDGSWMVSAHDFWPEHWGTLRLRAAYGTAGQQPGDFDADRTWLAVAAFDSEPSITPRNVGDPTLKPEVSHEVEFGFEMSLLEDRLSMEFNTYDQRTRDMLFNVRNAPSGGVTGTQLMNVGEIHNSGIELGVNATLISRRNFRWYANANFSTNNNEVVTLGHGADLRVHWTQWVRAGFPVAGFFDDRWIEVDGVVGLASELLADEDGNLPQDWDYIGPAFPTRTLNLGSTYSIGRNLTASFLVDYKGGHYLESATTRWLSEVFVGELQPLYDPNDPATERFKAGSPVASFCIDPADAIMEKVCSEDWAIARGNHVHPADNWRLREVSVAYRLPTSFAARMGASRATLSLAGRNLWRHQKYIGVDAEASYTDRTLSNQTYFDIPIPREFVAQIRVTF